MIACSRNFLVKLIAAALNPSVAGDSCVLLDDRDGLPTVGVGQNTTSVLVAAGLLFDATGVQARTEPMGIGWADLIFTHLSESKDDVVAHYGVLLPERATASGYPGRWLSTAQLAREKPGLMSIVSRSLNRV